MGGISVLFWPDSNVKNPFSSNSFNWLACLYKSLLYISKYGHLSINDILGTWIIRSDIHPIYKFVLKKENILQENTKQDLHKVCEKGNLHCQNEILGSVQLPIDISTVHHQSSGSQQFIITLVMNVA